MELHRHMIVPDAQQALPPAEPGDLPHLILRQVQHPLDEPGLLFLHLHDQLDPAGVQNALAVFAAVQPKQILHPLGGGDGDAAQAANSLDHFLHKACR